MVQRSCKLSNLVSKELRKQVKERLPSVHRRIKDRKTLPYKPLISLIVLCAVNPIVIQKSIKVGHVNGLRVPEDMLYVQGGGWLQAPLSINGKLLAPMQLCNVSSLNGFHLESLTRYLNDVATADTLHVEQAQFEQAPSYETLNGQYLHQLLDELWLDNEHVELKGVHLNNCSFEGLLEFEVRAKKITHCLFQQFLCNRALLMVCMWSMSGDITLAERAVSALMCR